MDELQVMPQNSPTSSWEGWAQTIAGGLLGAVTANREGTAAVGGTVGPAGVDQYRDANAAQYANNRPDYTKIALIAVGGVVALVLLKKFL